MKLLAMLSVTNTSMARSRHTRTALVSMALVTLLATCAGADPQSVEESDEDVAPRFTVHGVVDVRAVMSDDAVSWLDGGFGRVRYGDVDDGGDERALGFHLSQVSLVFNGRIAEDLNAIVHVNADTEAPLGASSSRLGIVESFLLWRPVLSPSARLLVRAGVTIPPFSMEHPETAWSTRYTITPSAIGTWIGEELKSTGVEATLAFALPGFNELELQAAAFTGNDATGALLAWRGWALHDRQGQLGDDLPMPAILSLTEERFFGGQGTRTEPFVEVDGDIGYHAQMRFKGRKWGQLMAGYYDNRGDVRRVDVAPRMNYAWDTSFYIAGLQLNAGPVTLIGQYIDGRAEMGPRPPAQVDTPFRAVYGLVSVGDKRTRLTFRYDDFAVDDEDVWLEGKDLSVEDGWATTVALIHNVGRRHRVQAEYIHLDVDHPFAVTAGVSANLKQDQFQLGYRVKF